mmetsp:Transcript_10709/g.16412  ORF Transcript_10709/g.16412 Transcript_10709/m.16412 type:complete len:124 (-) Transcript_10709:296-667(-)
MTQYGKFATKTATQVAAHLGMPVALRKDLVPSFTAKNTAPPGIFQSKGFQMPAKALSNSSRGFRMEKLEFGICNRTEAVSKGYFTKVFRNTREAPAKEPDTDSCQVVVVVVADLLFFDNAFPG